MRPAASTAIPSSRVEKEGNDEIYERIYVAILEHRLTPGSKLPEEKMAKVFNVSRSRIREVLSRLAYEKVVELVTNRGAYIAKPTVIQARDVFEARRVIEPAIMERLVRNSDPEAISSLRKHVELEGEARQRNDARAVIRLSGEFHNLCAIHAGNAAFTRSMRELSSQTCLIILLYDAALSESCRADEHSLIVDALERGDGAAASQLMLEHLDHIQSSLDLTDRLNTEVDLSLIHI